MTDRLKKALLALLLVLAALASLLFAAPFASAQDTHARDYASIDGKIETVLKLTATSTLASAGISAIPGDTATPIAEKLTDFTEYFLLILCVLYSDKYLITMIGAAVFRYLIPGACALLLVGLFARSKVWSALAAKIALFALAAFFIIPASLRVSDAIDASYQASIDATIAHAEELSGETSELADAADDSGRIRSILSRMAETADTLTDKAADTLNRFVETLAVMIVTSCVIPILVLLFFLWLIKQLTGIDPAAFPGRRHAKTSPGT